MLLCFILGLLALAQATEYEEKFEYSSQENITVPSFSQTSFAVSLSTSADEFLSETVIEASLQLEQSASTPYNLLYFAYQTPNGQLCYQSWLQGTATLEELPCNQSNSGTFNDASPCLNLSNCLSRSAKFKVSLSQELYEEVLLVLENKSGSELNICSTMLMQLSSENTWFYWGVGLTCFLLIGIAVYAGLIFYWMLKYKRVKKMFEQFKLTEEEELIKKET